MYRSVIFTFLILILLITACIENADPHLEETTISEIDSTDYFDSIYRPLAYTLDTFFLNRHQNSQFYGNVLFAEKGRVIFMNRYGYANLKHKDTLSLDHTFQLASASKPFTAIAILQLYEKGLLNLYDTVSVYIPNFPYSGIDIHQLLCHRSGLSQYTHFCDAPDSIWPDKKKTIRNEDIIDIISKIKPLPNYPPNKKYYYCNTNYILLAQIIEKVAGTSYQEYIKQHIFKPAGMESTIIFNRDNHDELVKPAIGYNALFQPTINIYLNGSVGDKGIYSNLHDMYAFDKALHNNKLILQKTKEIAFTAYSDTFKINQNYGYGFRLMCSELQDEIVYHTGWWKGFRTYYIRILNKDQTIIVLSNIKRGPFLKIEELIRLIS